MTDDLITESIIEIVAQSKTDNEAVESLFRLRSASGGMVNVRDLISALLPYARIGIDLSDRKREDEAFYSRKTP